MSTDDTDINDDGERMKTMLMKSSTVTGGVQRKEHTVEPKPTASSAQKIFLCQKMGANKMHLPTEAGGGAEDRG